MQAVPSPVADPKTLNPNESLLDRWDEAAAEKGPAGAKARQALAKEAVEKLSGAALGAFLEGLNARREKDTVDGLIEENKKTMFAGQAGRETREWLMEVVDVKFKERLCFQAGYYFTGPGFQEYLLKMKPPSAQDRLLTGYCCGIAESEPMRALEEFKQLKPKGLSFYGLLQIVKRFPENADFAKASGLYPNDFDKVNPLAKEVRREVLKRWAEFHPEAAARYVVDNPKVVAPDQLEHVLQLWLATAPDAAMAWLGGQPGGTLRDLGHEVAAKYFLAADRVKAWQCAALIARPDAPRGQRVVGTAGRDRPPGGPVGAGRGFRAPHPIPAPQSAEKAENPRPPPRSPLSNACPVAAVCDRRPFPGAQPSCLLSPE